MQEKLCWLGENDQEMSVSEDDSDPATPPQVSFLEDSTTPDSPPCSPLVPAAHLAETGKQIVNLTAE